MKKRTQLLSFFILFASILSLRSDVQAYTLQTANDTVLKKKWLTYINPDSNLLSSKNIQFNSFVQYDYRYYGLGYEGLGINPQSQNLYIHNEATVFHLPFSIDFNKGSGYMQTQRKAPMFSVNFDPQRMISQYANQLIEDEKKRIKKQLESDTNYSKYLQATVQLAYIQSLQTNRNYIQEIKSSENLLKAAYQLPDSGRTTNRQSVIDAERKVAQSANYAKLSDSLSRYTEMAAKLNPLYKLDTTQLELPKQPNREDLEGYMRKNTHIPSYLKWASYIKKLDIGVVYPDHNPLLFQGAGIKGVSAVIESRHFYQQVVYGKQLTTGDFFRDTFGVSNNKVAYIASGYQNTYIRLGANIYTLSNQSASDTQLYKYNFYAPKTSIIPGIEMEAHYKRVKATVRVQYALEDLTSKIDRFENEMINEGANIQHTNNTFSSKGLALISGIESEPWKKGPIIGISYRYNGKDYYAPSAPFAAPFNDVVELKMQQGLFKDQIKMQAGINFRKNLMQQNTANLNDRTMSGFFNITAKIKKLPTMSLKYMPMYRQSVWKGQQTTLQINQLNATVNYTHQRRRQLYALVANYTHQEIIVAGTRQVNQVVYIYQLFKPRKLPFQVSLITSYFNKPVSISADSVKTLSGKFQFTYNHPSKLFPSLYIEHSQNPSLSRKMLGLEWNYEQKYIGMIQLKLAYGTVEKLNEQRTNGLNCFLTYYRKII
jgi:hypothetical protein